MELISIIDNIVPSPYRLQYWTPLLVLVGWLALMGLLGLIVVVVYSLLRPKKEEGAQKLAEAIGQESFVKDLGLLVLYVLLFLGCWILVGSMVWILGVLYVTIFLEGDFGIWHFVLPYLLVLLTLPFGVLFSLKTWGAIKVKQGEEKKVLVDRKKIFIVVQIFFSLVFLLLFSALAILFLILSIVYSGGYVDSESFAIICLPMIPVVFSFLTGLWYFIELMILRREV